MTYKSIGDSLTDAEFYTFVHLIRYNNPITDRFNIKENTITNEYYKLSFNFDDCSVLDQGILITEKTRQNPPRIKLENVIFKHSNHNLQLKVLTNEDYRLNESDISDMSYQTITVPLVEDTETEIPLTGLNNGEVILFKEAEFLITHDKPTIVVIDDE